MRAIQYYFLWKDALRNWIFYYLTCVSKPNSKEISSLDKAEIARLATGRKNMSQRSKSLYIFFWKIGENSRSFSGDLWFYCHTFVSNRCLLFTFGAGTLPFERQRLVVWHVPWSQLWKVLEQRLGLTWVSVHPSKVSPLPAAIFKYTHKSFWRKCDSG